MKPIFASGVICTLVVLPFVVLEAINTGGFATYGFPASLFAYLWLMVFAFASLAMSIVHRLRADDGMLRPAGLMLKTALLVVISVALIGVLHDQMPCFLGMPNCD